jgi:L,D-transpeptidase-like protein
MTAATESAAHPRARSTQSSSKNVRASHLPLQLWQVRIGAVLGCRGCCVMCVTSRRFLLSLVMMTSSLFAAPAFAASEAVEYSGDAKPGTIVVQTEERRLYYILGDGKALRYIVGVGRSGKAWYGTTSIASKHIRPAWTPPADMRGSRGAFVIESGAPNNPMGEAALVLVDHELAIHGTNNPGSIGGFVSAGCIRMHNADILDLYNRVKVGTRVVMAH